jgi:hypothetical protein
MTRRYITLVAAFAFLLFALSLMAQTGNNSGQRSNAPNGSNSSQNPNSPVGDQNTVGNPQRDTSSGSWESHPDSTASSGQQSGSSTGQSSQSGSSMGQTSSSNANPTTLDGCLVREETDYYLIPRSGAPVHVSSSGGTDLSQHENHRVKLHGTQSAASSTGGDTSSQAGMSGTAAGTAGSQASGQTGTSGSVGAGTNPPSSSAGTASSGKLHSAATQDFTVDEVDMVSATCPSNWNPSYNPGAGTSSPSGGQNPPSY